MNIVETNRLVLRLLTEDDAEFIFRLLNSANWKAHISDKGLDTLEEARIYIRKAAIRSYLENGFGLFLVKLKLEDTPLGLCGLIKRDYLSEVDLGFAILPEFEGQGYTHEAASAVVYYAQEKLKLPELVAITSPGNTASQKLLQKLGLEYEKTVLQNGEELQLYRLIKSS